MPRGRSAPLGRRRFGGVDPTGTIVLRILTNQFEARIRGLEGVDPPTRLRLLLRDFVLFAATHPVLHRFMLREGAASMPYAVAAEFRLLTGRNPEAKTLVEQHVETLLALFFEKPDRSP